MELQRETVRVTLVSSLKNYWKLDVMLLRIFGLLPLSPNATVCDKALDILRLLIIPAMINVVVVPNILTVFNYDPDVDVMMESLSGCTESGGLEIKYIILYLRRDKLKELIESCQDLWESNHPRAYEILSRKKFRSMQKDPRIQVIGKVFDLRYVKRGYILTWVFLCVFNLTATCFAILPFLLKSTTVQALPVSPGFVINSTLMYKIVASGQCVVCYVSAFLLTAVDCLLPVLLINSCGQFDLIRAILNDINETYEAMVADGNSVENFEIFFKTNLDLCIVRHQQLLAHYAKIEESFNLYALVQMFIGLYTIALGLFNLSMGTPGTFKYVTILMTGVSQILICNWSPETVLDEANSTNLAVYNLPWYNGQCHSRKSMYFFLTMTQHPVRLTAGKFTVLSMQTFSSVLTNAMSLLTVLKTIT